MREHLRIAVCYWHSFCWPGSDVFGEGTFARPWFEGDNDRWRWRSDKLEVAFELFEKLGVPLSSRFTTATSRPRARAWPRPGRTSIT